jgi:DNA-binding transcriptional LysR family regulator
VLAPWRVRDGEGQPQELRIAPQLSLDDVQAIAGAGIAGFGLVQLPCWLLSRHVQTGELAFVRERCGVRAQDIHAVWPKTRYLPLKTRCAVDALVAEIPEMIRA